MKKNFSQLDNSYWVVHYDEPDAANVRFLARHKQAGKYEIGGLSFSCPAGIYQPHEFSSSRFVLRGLLSHLPNLGTRILELGTGSGVIGIYLASIGLNVTLLDIDPVAVVSAKNNALANNVQAIVLQSDLFSAVDSQKYDTIFFNIPFMDKEIDEPLEIISCDPGGELLLRFLDQAPNYLLPNGRVYVTVANIGNREAILKALSKYHETIVHAEYYACTGTWRWLLSAQPLSN